MFIEDNKVKKKTQTFIPFFIILNYLFNIKGWKDLCRHAVLRYLYENIFIILKQKQTLRPFPLRNRKNILKPLPTF